MLNSVWYADREHFEGEKFRQDGSRFYPESPKAKAFAAAQNVEFFVLIGTANFSTVKK